MHYFAKTHTPIYKMISTNIISGSSSAKERRAEILKLLEHNEELLVTDLSQLMHISEVTIRKDLTILQQRGLLLRTRGGAIRRPVENLNEDTSIGQKRLFNFREKQRIGQMAASLIREGDNILLDSGTTTMEIARNLDRFQHLTIITNAMNIAVELMKYERFNVIMLGGHLRINSHSVVGPLAIAALRNFTSYKLFLGVDSFSETEGVSTPSLEEALLNQQMIAQAQEVIAVFDSSKFNKRSFAHIADVSQINAIVTDHGLPAGMARRLEAAGLKVYEV